MNTKLYYGNNSQHNLDFEEEKVLSKKILAGEKAKRILNGNPALQKDERNILESSVREGELAYEHLVESNVPRAMKFAYETWLKNQSGLNALEDYQQAAMEIICVCARLYDAEKGYRFGTFAHNCLKHEMLRENAKTAYAIRVPEEQLMLLGKAGMNKNNAGEGQTEPSAAAPAKMLAVCGPCVSLQDPVKSNDADAEFGDILPDARALTAGQIEEQIDKEKLIDRLRTALESLPEDERNILKGRYGFYGEKMPMKAFVGTAAKSISGVQKKQQSAEKHLRDLYFNLPLAG